MQSNASDALALEGAVLRDFDRIYRENVLYVLSLVRRFGATRAQAEDLAHDVFEALFLKLASLPHATRESLPEMRAYLFRTAWQRLANHRRLHSVRNERASAEPPEPVIGPRAHDYVLAREMVRLLESLQPHEVAIFVGFEVFGATIPELAREQGMDEGDARDVLHHVRAVLRRSITPPPDGGETP